MSHFHVIDSLEDGVKERDLLNDQKFAADINTITYIEWMLDEEEDARTQEFLSSNRKDEGEGKKSSSSCSKSSSETRVEKSNCRPLANKQERGRRSMYRR